MTGQRPGLDGVQAQMADGSWQPAAPLGWQGSGPDFEVTRTGRRWGWTAWDEDMCVGRGSARTRIGLALSLRRAAKALRAELTS